MFEYLSDWLARFQEVMNSGGVVTWALFLLNLVLWYALGARYWLLRRATNAHVRRLVFKHRKKGDRKKIKGLMDLAVHVALEARDHARAAGLACRPHVADALAPFSGRIKKYSILIKTIVIAAPLIGLLGTVIGMIETFDALQSMSMFPQGNSIAGGISKALFTTEMGLVVAVPGLLLGRMLDRQESQYDIEFEQLTDILCTKVKS
ncbi:MAG: MotA/TolQ/ExbB proton channel family protein [Thiotrichales bacterium]